VDADYVADILPAMLLVGVGAGLSFPALTALAMSDATASDSGLASGLVNTTQQTGGALGLSILATLATSRTDGQLADGVGMASALTSGYHLAFGVGRRSSLRRSRWQWQCCRERRRRRLKRSARPRRLRH
jgi:hypothetical protein